MLSNKILYFFVALNTILFIISLFILEDQTAALFNFICACLVWVGIIGKENGNE